MHHTAACLSARLRIAQTGGLAFCVITNAHANKRPRAVRAGSFLRPLRRTQRALRGSHRMPLAPHMRGVGGRKTKVGVSAAAVHGGVLQVQEHRVVPLAVHEDHLWAVCRRSECEAPRADARGRPRASALGARHQGVSTAGPGRCSPSGGERATASWGGPPARASSAAGGQLGSACGICIGAHAARRFMGRGVTRAELTKWKEDVEIIRDAAL